MKKIILPSLAILILTACNNGGPKNGEKVEPQAADITQSAEYKEGFQLVASNGCPTCHKVDDRVTGPSYREVAIKYGNEPRETVLPLLAGKIISGGSGVWGEVPMIPHPAVSQADAEKMVKYILLLKK